MTAAAFAAVSKLRLLLTHSLLTLLKQTIFKHQKNLQLCQIIEVIASSDKGIDDAIRQAVAEASKTVRNIDSVYVKDIKAHVKDGQVTSFGCICKISFRLE
jgi:dodecin